MQSVNLNKTILIADDNSMCRNIFLRTFQADYRVLTADSGAQALDLAKREHPDLIVLDILMPDMSGHKVIRHLKADELLRDIPVVFLTGMTEMDDELKGLELGAIDYWTKPIQPGIIRARARNYLELKGSRDVLEKMAFQDGLTRIANRRAFDETLDREWRRARRSGEPLSIILADVDHFKNYNDTRGHGAGDDCLRQIAAIIQSNMKRATDFAARYGGEEFVCILANTNLMGGMEAAGKLRLAVEQTKIPHGASKVSPFVTMSFGVTACIPGKFSTSRDLLEAADTALYQAKNAGRNCLAKVDVEHIQHTPISKP